MGTDVPTHDDLAGDVGEPYKVEIKHYKLSNERLTARVAELEETVRVQSGQLRDQSEKLGTMLDALSFDELAQEIHAWALGKGFYDREWIMGGVPKINPSMPAEKLMLIVSELSEALSGASSGRRTSSARCSWACPSARSSSTTGASPSTRPSSTESSASRP